MKQQFKVEYTGRALRQDADEAMKGDIVRGLIELITNADDAYTYAGSANGGILVEIERARNRPWLVKVKDQATGMTKAEMRARIMRIGARTSGFEEGRHVRGNRGRGAKDMIAFGPVVFESIKDGIYSLLELRQDGVGDIESSKATPDAHERLGIRKSGTVVSVSVTNKGVTCPVIDKLAERLRKHYQLRYITTDVNRRLLLMNLKDGNRQQLRFEVDLSNCEQHFDEELVVEGYSDAQAHLRLWRLAEKSEEPASDPGRTCGILIRGRRTVYDNTLFSYESNPLAGWFYGELDCEYIDELVNAYDDRLEAGEEPTPENPVPIVSRRRDGLMANHPFAESLRNAGDKVLERFIRDEQERQRVAHEETATNETKKVLSKLAREAAKFLKDALSEIDEDVVGPVPAEGFPALAIRPPKKFLETGESTTLTVHAAESGHDSPSLVSLLVTPTDIVEVREEGELPMEPHARHEGLRVGRIHLLANMDGTAVIEARVGELQATAEIVVGARIAEETEPLELCFDRPRYVVVWNRTKRVGVRAPTSLIESHGSSLHVRSDNPGVVVRKSIVEFRPHATGNWYVGSVQVEGRALGSAGTLTAVLGDRRTSAAVRVVQRDDGGPDLEIRLQQKEASTYRALFEPPDPKPGERQVIEVMTRHPSLRGVIGAHWQHQHSPEWNVLLAEVVTEAIVRRILEAKYPAGTSGPDAAMLYQDMFSYSTKLLPLMQKHAHAMLKRL